MAELPKAYEAKNYEDEIYARWERSGFFTPENLPNYAERPPYTIVLPPPNATGKLHAGHTMWLQNTTRGSRAAPIAAGQTGAASVFDAAGAHAPPDTHGRHGPGPAGPVHGQNGPKLAKTPAPNRSNTGKRLPKVKSDCSRKRWL